jgi:DNA uptake protein ComE-like DNA-binding protein
VATPAKRQVGANWVWISLTPFGLGAWAPAYAGSLVRKRSWVLQGLLWSIITIAGWVLAIVNHGGAAGGLLIILGWAGGVASSFAIRADYRRLVESPFEASLTAAEQRLRDRGRARTLAAEHPAVAKELGIGRPDLPNAQPGGLVDINNAPAAVLTELPGVDAALAGRIVEARAETHGFSSVEDLGAALDLDGNLVEDLRARAVFLPM